MKRFYLVIISIVIIYLPVNSQDHLSVSSGLNLPVAGFNESFAHSGGAAKPGYAVNIDFNTLLLSSTGIGMTLGHSTNGVNFSKMEFDIESATYDAQSGDNYQYFYAMPYFFFRMDKVKFFYDFKLKAGIISASFPKTKGLLYSGVWAFDGLSYERDNRWDIALIPSITAGYIGKKLVYSFDIAFMDFSAKHLISRPEAEIYTEEGVGVGHINFPSDTRGMYYQNLTITIGAGFKL